MSHLLIADAETFEGGSFIGKFFDREWWLLHVDRRFVVLGLAVLVLSVLVAIGCLPFVSVRDLASTSDPVETLFQGLVGAIITGVTLVLTINQLVLSQELGGLADQRERMRGAMDFFEDYDELIDDRGRTLDPANFLGSLLDSIAGRADTTLEESSRDDSDLTAALEAVQSEAKASREKLDGTQFGTFEVISAALSFNYSHHLNELRSIVADGHGGPEALGELVSLLEAFGPAREHVKTLYFQWDLIELSKMIIYTGIPALVVSVGTILFLNDPASITGATLGVSNLLTTIAVLTTVSLAPFFVLVAYVLRVATVTRRTLAMGPLVLND